jgi:hypothetical protein
VKQQYPVRKVEKDKWICIDKYRYKIQKQKEVPVSIPAYTGPFRALTVTEVMIVT